MQFLMRTASALTSCFMVAQPVSTRTQYQARSYFLNFVWFFFADGMAILQSLGDLGCDSPIGACQRHHMVCLLTTNTSSHMGLAEPYGSSGKQQHEPSKTLLLLWASFKISRLLYHKINRIQGVFVIVEHAASKTQRMPVITSDCPPASGDDSSFNVSMEFHTLFWISNKAELISWFFFLWCITGALYHGSVPQSLQFLFQ